MGTNSGFVSAAPSADPAGDGNLVADNNAWGCRHTSPATATKVTELGCWIDNATEAANMEIGIYTHDAVNDEPEALVGSVSFAKGTTSGWKTQACDIAISASTIYWVVVQVDNTSTTTNGDYGDGEWVCGKYAVDTLPDPWGTSSDSYENYTMAVYGVWEAAAPPPSGGNSQMWANF